MLFLSIVTALYHADDSARAEIQQTGAALLISEFYPSGLSDDEYLVLSNMRDSPLNLRNWSISDGEGAMRFRSDLWLAPSCSFVLTMNSSSYESAFGCPADWSPSDENASTLIESSGRFRLADSGDSVSLLASDGAVADFVVYGNCFEHSADWRGPPIPSYRAGEVARRLSPSGVWLDSNTASDWLGFREFRYGYTIYSSFASALPAGSVTAFVSPDCSLGVVLAAIESARVSIMLCSYEIDSSPVCSALVDALSRRVPVTLLVDGAPAGGISGRELTCLSALCGAGALVRLVNGNLSSDAVQHVGALHSKYMVIDSLRSIVMSENFVEDGLPLDTVCGNRGWGIMVDSAGVAQYLGRAFSDDSRPSRPDVQDWREDRRYDPGARIPAATAPNHTVPALMPLVSVAEAEVLLEVSPDCSPSRPFILDWFERANYVLAEQFQADLVWESRWGGESTNPIVSALADCAARGARFRVLFDSSWFNAGRNKEVSDYLARCWTTSDDAEVARLLDNRNPMSLLHNKGIVFDGAISVVSSNNWVSPSFAKNREMAAIIKSEEIARYFARAFDFDWEPDVTPPDASAGEDMRVPLGQIVHLTAADSVDDRSVVHWSWDLGSDGAYDGFDECFEFPALETGDVKVDLVVEDSWGNRAWDSVTVTVVAPSSVAHDRPGGLVPYPVMVGASVVGGLLVGCAVARSRVRAARKINQQRPD